MLNKAISASFVCLALTACSDRLVFTAGPLPDAATTTRSTWSLGSTLFDPVTVDVQPISAWYQAHDSDPRTAIVEIGAPADREPRVIVDALNDDGCLLARGFAPAGGPYWAVQLAPVDNCGVETAPPSPEPMPMPEQPQPDFKDSDGDGVIDSHDLCPDVAAGATPDPRRLGCPAPAPTDIDGDGILDDVDLCPRQPSGSYPDPRRLGCPQPDSDGDGVGDIADICPAVAAGSSPSPQRPGCPAPREVVLPLGQPVLTGPVAVAGQGYAVAAGFDFATNKPVPGALEWAVTLPPEAATARSAVLDYDVAAALAWYGRSPGCIDGFKVAGAGTSSACVRPEVRYGLVVDGIEGGGALGAVPQLDRKGAGDVDVVGAQRLAIRLSMQGDVAVGVVAVAARVRLSW